MNDIAEREKAPKWRKRRRNERKFHKSPNSHHQKEEKEGEKGDELWMRKKGKKGSKKSCSFLLLPPPSFSFTPHPLSPLECVEEKSVEFFICQSGEWINEKDDVDDDENGNEDEAFDDGKLKMIEGN